MSGGNNYLWSTGGQSHQRHDAARSEIPDGGEYVVEVIPPTPNIVDTFPTPSPPPMPSPEEPDSPHIPPPQSSMPSLCTCPFALTSPPPHLPPTSPSHELGCQYLAYLMQHPQTVWWKVLFAPYFPKREKCVYNALKPDPPDLPLGVEDKTQESVPTWVDPKEEELRQKCFDMIQWVPAEEGSYKDKEKGEKKDWDMEDEGSSEEEWDAENISREVTEEKKSDEPTTEQRKLPLYEPFGKWEWAKGLVMENMKTLSFIGEGIMATASVKKGFLGGKSVKYISKSWKLSNQAQWEGFYSELALYKSEKYAKALQGTVIPALIGVYVLPMEINIAMEPPHPVFWIEASQHMPEVLKERCIDGLKALHARGVMHGDVENRHMLIGPDLKVTFIDLNRGKATVPHEDVGLEKAEPADFALEMRRLLYKLDYNGMRAFERNRALRVWDRQERNEERAKRRQKYKVLGANFLDISDDEEEEEDPTKPTPEPGIYQAYFSHTDNCHPLKVVMPGTTKEEYDKALREFMTNLAEAETKRLMGLAKKGSAPCPIHPPPVRTAVPSPLQTTGGYNLRKRKRSTGQGSGIVRKVRRSSNNTDVSLARTRSSVSHRSVCEELCKMVEEEAEPSAPCSIPRSSRPPSSVQVVVSEAETKRTSPRDSSSSGSSKPKPSPPLLTLASTQASIAIPPSVNMNPAPKPHVLVAVKQELPVASTCSFPSTSTSDVDVKREETASPKPHPPIKVRDFAYEQYDGPRGFVVPWPALDTIQAVCRRIHIHQTNVIACTSLGMGHPSLPGSRLSEYEMPDSGGRTRRPRALGTLTRMRRLIEDMAKPEVVRYRMRGKARELLFDHEMEDDSEAGGEVAGERPSLKRKRAVSFGDVDIRDVDSVEYISEERLAFDSNERAMKIARLANAQAARAQRPIPSPKSILRPSVTVKTYPIGENPRAVLGQLSPKLSPVHDWDKLRAAYMRATTDPARQAAMGYGRGPQGGTTDGIRPNYPAAGGIVPQPPSQTIGGLQIAAQRPFPGQNSGAPPPMAIQTSAGQIQGDAALNGPPSLGRPLPSQPMSPSEVIARNMAMSTVRPDAIPLAGPSSLGPTHPRGVMPFPGRRAEHIGDDVPSISGTRPLRSPYSIASSHGLNDAPPQVGMAPDQDRPGASTSGSGGDMSPGPSSVTFHSADEVSKRLARKTVEVISSRPRSRGLASESRISKHPRVSKGRTAPSVDDERFSILSGEVEEEGMDTIGQGEDAVVPREACRTILPSTSWYSKLFHWL